MKPQDQARKQKLASAGLHSTEDRKIFEDISALNNELVTAHRELAKRNAALVRLNEQKKHLLSVAAHDLRNPLGAIYSCSEYLLDELKNLNDDQLEMLRSIRTSSLFMLDLIEDILHLARLESGKIELRIEPTDVAELASHHIAVNRPIAARKNIHIDVDIDPNLPLIEADSHKIGQVLENLISNAIKFSPSNTVIEVALRRDDERVRIAVRDHGPGIPEAERGKLFQPFQRTSVKPTGNEKSSGLGLAIARQILEAHSGKIWFESEVGRGSTFFVSLPKRIKPVVRGGTMRK